MAGDQVAPSETMQLDLTVVWLGTTGQYREATEYLYSACRAFCLDCLSQSHSNFLNILFHHEAKSLV